MQERVDPYGARAGPVWCLYRSCTGPARTLYGSCTGPVRVPVQIPYITHIMAAQVWHKHRTRIVRALQGGRAGPVQVLCGACTGPVQFLSKTVGHIPPTRPLSVKGTEGRASDLGDMYIPFQVLFEGETKVFKAY